jgi:hypothetical protein
VLLHEGRLERGLHDLRAHGHPHGLAAGAVHRGHSPLAILSSLDESLAEGTTRAHLHAVGEAARGVAGARFHERELGHVEFALGTKDMDCVMRGSESVRHAATAVAVDEEGGCKVLVPEFSESSALGTQLAHGGDLFRFHGSFPPRDDFKNDDAAFRLARTNRVSR